MNSRHSEEMRIYYAKYSIFILMNQTKYPSMMLFRCKIFASICDIKTALHPGFPIICRDETVPESLNSLETRQCHTFLQMNVTDSCKPTQTDSVGLHKCETLPS